MIELDLRFSPPFDWDAMLAFYAARAIAGVERVCGETYLRTFALGEARGSFAVARAGKQRLHVSLRTDDESAVFAIERRLRDMFDLDAKSAAIDARLAADPRMSARVAARRGVRVPGTWDAFEAALRAILGQQISVAAAITLAGRLAAKLAEPLPDPLTFEGGPRLVFPDPSRFVDADLSGLGLTRMRVRTLHEFARAALADPALLVPSEPAAALERKLTSLPGIGPWTFQYLALRGFYDRDAFPASDLGLLKAMESARGRPSARELVALAEPLRPYRAYAVIRLWTQPNAVKSAS